MRTVAVIQARLGSKRLPRKVLMDICGKPMIQHVIERAQAIPGIGLVILAIPEEDLTSLSRVYGETGCTIAWGPRDDVLSRFVGATHHLKPDVVMRLTGDCPLIAPEVCEKVLDVVIRGMQSQGQATYLFASNDTQVGKIIRSGYPDGLDCECFSFDLLALADREAKDAGDREHVTPWMRAHAANKAVVGTTLRLWPKLSVDTRADLLRVRRIMARIPAGDYSWRATKKAIEEEGLCASARS